MVVPYINLQEDPNNKYLSDLDKSIGDILVNEKLAVDEKVKLYNSAIHKFQNNYNLVPQSSENTALNKISEHLKSFVNNLKDENIKNDEIKNKTELNENITYYGEGGRNIFKNYDFDYNDYDSTYPSFNNKFTDKDENYELDSLHDNNVEIDYKKEDKEDSILSTADQNPKDIIKQKQRSLDKVISKKKNNTKNTRNNINSSPLIGPLVSNMSKKILEDNLLYQNNSKLNTPKRPKHVNFEVDAIDTINNNEEKELQTKKWGTKNAGYFT